MRWRDKMFLWEIKYIYNGKRDVMYFGSAISNEDKKERLEKLNNIGFKVIGCRKTNKL